MTLGPIEIKAIPFSISTMKVLAALGHKKIPYSVKMLNPLQLKKLLPAPHLVPVMTCGKDVIPDSTAILKYLDHALPGPATFYPQGREDIAGWSAWVEDELLIHLFYYSIWDDEGWRRATLPLAKSILPTPLRILLPQALLRNMTKSSRKDRVMNRFGADVVASEPKVRVRLYSVLHKLDEAYKASPTPWLCSTDEPSGADFALYGLLNALVDHSGDCNTEPFMPALLEDAEAPHVRRSFDEMKRLYPIRFYPDGKGVDWGFSK